jgi:hypothetical protein
MWPSPPRPEPNISALLRTDMKESSGEDSRELKDLELRIPPTTITSQLRLEHTRPEPRIELKVALYMFQEATM